MTPAVQWVGTPGGIPVKKPRGKSTETIPTFKKEVVIQRFENFGDEWFVRIFIGSRQYRFYRLKTSDLQKAQEEAFVQWEKCIERLNRGDESKYSISRLFYLFIENEQKLVDRDRLAQTTLNCKKSQIENGILPYIAAKRLRDARKVKSNTDFREYPDFRLDQGKSDGTINNEIITIKEAFRWMRREGLVDYEAPFIESITINQSKRDLSNPPIPIEDFERIRKYLDDQLNEEISRTESYYRHLFKTCVLTSASAALRPHEWRALTWGMVQLGKENEISIPPECKTGRRLVVFKSQDLSFWKQFQKHWVDGEITSKTPLGLNPNTRKPLSDQSYQTRWLEMMEALDMNYTLYSLRATGICVRLEAGVPIFTVARWAGNSVRVTEQHYTASIMKSERMKTEVLKDVGDRWEGCGIEFRRQ